MNIEYAYFGKTYDQNSDAETVSKVCKNKHFSKEPRMPWFKQKTIWTGIAGIVTGIGLVISGDMNTGVQTILIGISTITMRQAIAKK